MVATPSKIAYSAPYTYVKPCLWDCSDIIGCVPFLVGLLLALPLKSKLAPTVLGSLCQVKTSLPFPLSAKQAMGH